MLILTVAGLLALFAVPVAVGVVVLVFVAFVAFVAISSRGVVVFLIVFTPSPWLCFVCHGVALRSTAGAFYAGIVKHLRCACQMNLCTEKRIKTKTARAFIHLCKKYAGTVARTITNAGAENRGIFVVCEFFSKGCSIQTKLKSS